MAEPINLETERRKRRRTKNPNYILLSTISAPIAAFAAVEIFRRTILAGPPETYIQTLPTPTPITVDTERATRKIIANYNALPTPSPSPEPAITPKETR